MFMYGINVSCKYLCRGGHGLQLYPTNNDTRHRGNLGVQCSIVSTCMCDGCRVFGLPIVMTYATQFAEANDRRYYIVCGLQPSLVYEGPLCTNRLTIKRLFLHG